MVRRLCVVLALIMTMLSMAAGANAADIVLLVRAESRAGEPVGGTCFEVYVDDGAGGRGPYVNAFCDDADGSVNGSTLIRLPAGRYLLAESATPDGFAPPPDVLVDLSTGEPVVRLTIQHDPAGAPAPTPVPAEPATTPAAEPSATTGGGGPEGRFEVSPGRFLYLSCHGADEPTVVLEAGGPGRTSDDWREVVAGLSGVTRVCVYDRASLGQSDPAPDGPRTIDDSVDDLRRLLAVAGVRCPCVFGGNSWGGVIVRRYAGLYPAEVSGLISVDAVPPGFLGRFLELVPDGSPPDVLKERDRLLGSANPEHVDQLASLRLAEETAPPPVPAAVMTHGQEFGLGFAAVLPADDLESAWRAAQEEYARQLGVKLIVAEKSGSDVTLEQPQLVADVITQIVEIVRTPAKGLGVIQVLPVTEEGQPLLGICVQLITMPENGEPEVLASACDADDTSLDGSLIFAGLPPGTYVVRDYHTPPGYPHAADIQVQLVLASVERVLVKYQREGGTPTASPVAAAP